RGPGGKAEDVRRVPHTARLRRGVQYDCREVPPGAALRVHTRAASRTTELRAVPERLEGERVACAGGASVEEAGCERTEEPSCLGVLFKALSGAAFMCRS